MSAEVEIDNPHLIDGHTRQRGWNGPGGDHHVPRRQLDIRAVRFAHLNIARPGKPGLGIDPIDLVLM